jgi:general nucleoside transport system permease protein
MDDTSDRKSLLFRIITQIGVLYVAPILLSFCLCSIILIAIKTNPISIYSKLIFGSFKSAYWFSELILKTTPLLICSLAVSLALKVGFWNIGVEGQFCIGAWSAGGIAIYFQDLPIYALLPLMFLGGILCASLWIAIPAVLKIKLKVNEIITTLLMNYIAVLWLDYFVYGRWKGSDGFPYTEIFSESAFLPSLFGQRAHIGIFIALILAVAIYFMLKKTRLGYKVRVVGENIKSAKYGGINTAKIILIVTLASGGIAGLAGVSDVSGIHHRLHPNILLGYGYTAIIIAWLAKNDPLRIIAVSLLFGVLAVGGDIIQVDKVPNSIVKILQALIFLSMLVADSVSKLKLSFKNSN